MGHHVTLDDPEKGEGVREVGHRNDLPGPRARPRCSQAAQSEDLAFMLIRACQSRPMLGFGEAGRASEADWTWPSVCGITPWRNWGSPGLHALVETGSSLANPGSGPTTKLAGYIPPFGPCAT